MHKFSKLMIIVSLAAVLGLFAGSSSAAAGQTRLFRLLGTATAHTCKIPRTEQGTTNTDLCFTVDLFEFRDGAFTRVGTATDALADLRQVGDGLAVTGTTFFNLPEGRLVTREL